jgi:hypothetical protein
MWVVASKNLPILVCSYANTTDLIAALSSVINGTSRLSGSVPTGILPM